MIFFYFFVLFSVILNAGNNSFSQIPANTFFDIKINNNIVYIDSVSVNGLSSGNFIFDTGSQLTVLNDNFISNLNLLNSKKTITAVDINGNVSSKQKIHIDSLKIGGYCVYNIDGFVADLSIISENVDGIIGANCLMNGIWMFDFPANKIHLLSHVDANDYKYQIPFKLKNGLAFVNLKIADSVLKNVVFDTGNTNRISFAVADSVLLKGKSDIDFYYLLLNNSLFGNKEKILRIKESFFTSIFMNNMKIDSCYSVFYGNVRAIGLPFIKESVVVLDYVNKKIYTNGLHQKSELNFGCRFKITKHGKIFVSSIRENSLAAENGLNLGDELIRIDNIESDRLQEIVRDGSIYKKLNSETIIQKTKENKVSIISSGK